MNDSGAFIKTTVIPNWMVHLAVWVVGSLGAGAVMTLVSVVNWGFWLQSEQGRQDAAHKQAIGEVRAEVSAMKVKQDDFNAMLIGVNRTVGEMDRKLDRLMPP